MRPYLFRSGAFRAVYEGQYLFKCDGCGLGQIDCSTLDESKLGSYYKYDYRRVTNIGNVTSESAKLYYEARGAALVHAVERFANGNVARIFEIGAGHGFNLLAAKQRFPNATLFTDEPDDAITQAAVINRGSLDEGPYDAVILSHVLDHIADPIVQLHRVSRALRPGGVLVIEVPNENLSVASYQGCDEPHVSFFDRATLTKVLGKVKNLMVTDIFTAGRSRSQSNPKSIRSIARTAAYSVPILENLLTQRLKKRGMDFTTPTEDGMFLRTVLVRQQG